MLHTGYLEHAAHRALHTERAQNNAHALNSCIMFNSKVFRATNDGPTIMDPRPDQHGPTAQPTWTHGPTNMDPRPDHHGPTAQPSWTYARPIWTHGPTIMDLRNSNEWRMKTKIRLPFIGAALFVLYVSYKILEPELFRKWPEKQSPNDNELKNVAEKSSVLSNSSISKDSKSRNITIAQVIQTMIENYKPDFTFQLKGSPWDVAAKWVEPRQIHPENAKEMGVILKSMSQGAITSVDFGQKGTQLKLTFLIDDVQKVIFKPAWYPRDYIVTGTPYSGRDRHNAEIAAFYLGSLLGLRRTPLAVGRRISIEKDILPVATSRLLTTFFEKDGESCFYGRCLYCKGPEDGVCATNGILEGTLVLWLPKEFKMALHKHPWSRTYREGVQA
ncbi:Glycosaminoglycan xylosylkinase, partial [Bulinus truncatus]